MLKANNLFKSYNKRNVVDDLSITVSKGEVVGLLGPNGAGKTTSFYMIVGMISPLSGEIILEKTENEKCVSINITKMPMYKRARLGIGYLPQESSIFRKLTVEENLEAILELLDISREERKKRKDNLLEKLRIDHIRDREGYKLSGGERRRVEIARALTTNPEYLLLDEPFTGIDPKVKEDIQGIIRSLAGEGIGILITDHNVRETLEITDIAHIIYEGKILLSGSAEELIKDKKAREIYLGERFKL